MAKDKLTDYDSTAANNLDVGGISVAEGMLPSGVNNAIRELMSHQADAFGAGTPLYVDQTNNRLGINQATPAHPLHVGTDDLILDASGNLLVGTTDNNVADNSGASNGGINIGTAGVKGIISAAAGQTVAYLNRLGSNGDIAVFRKDGSTVGSIGTTSGYLTIGSGVTGLLFDDISDKSIRPWNLSTNTASDADTDLGLSSQRFRNLHLSGGVVFGATGGTVTSKTLDDYETGTWTPRLRGGISEPGTLITGNGIYTKIGRLVTVTWDFSNVNTTSYSGTLSIDQLTFAPASSYMSGGNVMFNLMASFPTTTSNISCYLTSSSNSILFYGSENQAGWSALNHHAGTSARYSIGSLTYETT